MKRLFIIANWKSNKTTKEAKAWLKEYQISNIKSAISNKEVIICPSSTLLSTLEELANELGIKLGAQDVSPYGQGAYTGEVNASQIKEFGDYVIIGHSERREHFFENDEMLSNKVEQSLMVNLIPIFCIQSKQTPIPLGVKIVAYEPVFAIGTGNPDTPESANDVASYIKTEKSAEYVLYGGSVTFANVKNFTNMPDIDGVLVGNGSLKALEFLEIVKNA